MVSEMAIADLERFAANGVRVSWRDAIRLNAFGVRCESRSDVDGVSDLPRVAIVDDLILREPPIAAEIWLAKVARRFDFSDADTHLQIRVFACVVSADALPDGDDVAAVRAAVAEFTRARLGALTRRRLWAALSYLLLGDNAAAGEERAANRDAAAGAESAAPKNEDECVAVGVLHEAMILKLGTAADLRKMTRREVESVVAYAEAVKFGESFIKSQRGERLAEYFAVLDEIRKGAEKEDGAGDD